MTQAEVDLVFEAMRVTKDIGYCEMMRQLAMNRGDTRVAENWNNKQVELEKQLTDVRFKLLNVGKL